MPDAPKRVDLSKEPGIQQAGKVFGEGIARMLAEFWSDMDEHFARSLCNYAYGDMYSREILPQRVRELCAVAVLTALDQQNALAVHIQAALRNGASPKEVAEAICQAHLYAGIPCTMNGLVTFRRVVKELEEAAAREKALKEASDLERSDRERLKHDTQRRTRTTLPPPRGGATSGPPEP
ncbi:MAG: carboxymuconolactone decarboxylase family protein [Planctomycetes bacterium]|nr:carboxymuconolactone decarboxylase family protein [Planctomycetota bacterium]